MRNKKNKFNNVLFAIIFLGLFGVFISCKNDKKEKEKIKIGNYEPSKKGISSVQDFRMKPYPNTEEGRLAEYGEKIITETYKYFLNEDGSNINNELACASCHVKAGIQAYGIPFVGLTKLFPTYTGREDKISTLEDRINGCFERSMSGKAIDDESEEMRAIVAYMDHLSQDVTVTGKRIEGQLTPDLAVLPDRAADLDKGAEVFDMHCAVCHMKDGKGMRKPDSDKGYLYPPLQGENTFNDGAGMHRMLTAAKFIKSNMPTGTTYKDPVLTDEEAYDVAAYINSFDRPHKENRDKDYPDLSKKPKDAPFPPYYDESVPAEQYKYGPFNWEYK